MELIEEGYLLKQEIDKKTERLREINKELINVAEFKPGSQSGHYANQNIKVTVSIKDNVKWDQGKIKEVKQYFPDFDKVFKTVYKPESEKVMTHVIGDNEAMRKAIEWCREISTGQPQVKYERIDDEDKGM